MSANIRANKAMALALLVNQPIVYFAMMGPEENAEYHQLVISLTSSEMIYEGLEENQRHAASERLKDLISPDTLNGEVIESVCRRASDTIKLIADEANRRTRCRENFREFLILTSNTILKNCTNKDQVDEIFIPGDALGRVENTFYTFSALELLQKPRAENKESLPTQ